MNPLQKIDALAEGAVEYPLSFLTGAVAPAFGVYDAYKKKGTLADRLRAFQGGTEEHTYQPKGALSQAINSTIAENTPKALAEGLRSFDEWSQANPGKAMLADAALSTLGSFGGKAVKEIFRGPLTKAETAAARKAHEAIQAGADPADVWQRTGWGRAPGSTNYVTEIDDSKLQMLDFPPEQGREIGFNSMVSHPEFSNLYDASGMKFGGEPGQGATYHPSTGTIDLGMDLEGDELKKSVVHELQHVVQGLHGHQPGSSPNQFGYDAADISAKLSQNEVSDALRNMGWNADENDLEALRFAHNMDRNRINQMLPKGASMRERQQMSNLLRAWDDQIQQKNEALKKYKRTQGEAMARLTEGRLNLTAAERREDYPFSPNYFKRLTDTAIEDLWSP